MKLLDDVCSSTSHRAEMMGVAGSDGAVDFTGEVVRLRVTPLHFSPPHFAQVSS